MSTFLSADDIAVLTGRKVKSKQIETLRKMGIAFWVNACGKPIVTLAAIEGRKEAPQPKQWTPPN
jgi:hypothetical protein